MSACADTDQRNIVEKHKEYKAAVPFEREDTAALLCNAKLHEKNQMYTTVGGATEAFFIMVVT